MSKTQTAPAARKTTKTDAVPTKALAKRDNEQAKALVTQAALDLFAQDAAYAGEFGTEDRAINFLRIAQSMTPQAKKLDPNYIPGCEEGVFFTSLTRRVLPSVRFLPSYWTKNYTWWKPRNAGGGLVKNFATDKEASRLLEATRNPDNGRLELRGMYDGLPVVEVVEADLYFGFIVDDDGTLEECVLSLTSTQLPKARKWNSLMHALRHPKTGQPLPLFARVYDLTTVGEQNERGSWAGLVVTPGPMLPDVTARWDVLYGEAKSLADACRRGKRATVVDVETAQVVSVSNTTEDDDAEDYEVAGDDETLV
jgi:hypothetical protein